MWFRQGLLLEGALSELLPSLYMAGGVRHQAGVPPVVETILPPTCNLLRPLLKMLFLLVPYGYIIRKIKKDSKGDDSNYRMIEPSCTASQLWAPKDLALN